MTKTHLRLKLSDQSCSRSYDVPPESIHLVLQATLLFVGQDQKDTETWPACREIACSKYFAQGLLNYDVGRMELSEHRISQIKSMLYTVGGEENAQHVSSVARILFKWVRSALTLYEEWCRQRMATSTTEINSIDAVSEEAGQEAQLTDPLLPQPEPDHANLVPCDEAMASLYATEAAYYNDLVMQIKMNVETIRCALDGKRSLTNELHEMVMLLLADRVPLSWGLRGCPGPVSLSSWLMKLVSRLRFMREWGRAGRPIIPSSEFAVSSATSRVIWLGGLSSPDVLAPTLLREYAKSRKIVPDPLGMRVRCRPADTVAGKWVDGPGRCVVVGIQLHGATWQKEECGLLEAECDLSCPLPPLQLDVIEESSGAQASSNSNGRLFRCPVFRTVEFDILEPSARKVTDNHKLAIRSTAADRGSLLIADLPTAPNAFPTRHWELHGVCASIDGKLEP
eukprot:SAG31_NODE_1_length_62978_cov_30.836130_12_plen_453_part_00